MKERDYFEWDFVTWGRSLKLFTNQIEQYIQQNSGGLALEIGSRNGGISLWLASFFNIRVLCTDLINPEENCKSRHEEYIISGKIAYYSLDILNIQYADNTFDVVIFKSVIGALGSRINQERALNEIYRVLKPGGILLFAENAKASKLHMFFRLKFNSWSKYWYYPDINEMNYLLRKYNESRVESTGVLAAFFRNVYLNKIFAKLDITLMKFFPAKFQYVLYGYAKK